jgi:RHS repeat-associated protein
MQLSSDVRIPDGLLAANALLSEKPHQGVPSWNLALHQGIDERNSTAAIGLRVGQHLNRAWSRYTGKERDNESGNDYFLARYYNSNTGRFLSPDWDAKSSDPVPYAKLDNPQSLNLYSYVGNNPMSRTDPTGHQCKDNDNKCKAKAIPQKKKPDANKTEVNKLYNEYSSLRPDPGDSTTSDLNQARKNAAHVYDNTHGKGFQGSSGLNPNDARDIKKPATDAAQAYSATQDAVAAAAKEPDTTQGANHAYIYDPAAIDSGQLHEPTWVSQGETTTVKGPFINQSGGGDIPKGDEVYVITVKDQRP